MMRRGSDDSRLPAPLEPSRPKIPRRPTLQYPRDCSARRRFPYATDRSTRRGRALAKYLGMLDTVGFDRGVLVQGSAHGRDQFGDARCVAQNRCLRGVAVPMKQSHPRRCGDGMKLGCAACASIILPDGQLHYRGGVPLDAAQRSRCDAELGWHLQSGSTSRICRRRSGSEAIGLPGDRSHGRTDARAGTGTDGFRACCARSARAGAGQLSGAHRIVRTRPTIPKRAVHEALCARQSGAAGMGRRLAHPRRRGQNARSRHLFELFQAWTPDEATQQRILVSNPAAIYLHELKARQKMRPTTSACSTSNIWRTDLHRDLAARDVRLDGWKEVPMKSAALSWPPRSLSDRSRARRTRAHFHVPQRSLAAGSNLLIVLQQWRGL